MFPSPAVDTVIDALPKVELHVHLLGSARLETVLELARRHPEKGVPVDRDDLLAFYAFTDFPHFLRVYQAVSSLIVTGEDVRLLVVGLAEEQARQNVRYAEVTVTPDNHLGGDLAGDDLLQGLADGRRQAAERCGVDLAWCFDIPGEAGVAAGRRTLDFALTERPDGLVSFGLGGPEVGVGRAQFEPFFTAAREAGLHSVPHAGETTGPATIWSAIRDLGAERIGHGTSCVDDPGLVAHLRDRRIPLEVCPTSNIRTRQVSSIEAHPVRAMLENGLTVTLSTDDPPMFGATLIGEYRAVAGALRLDEDQVAGLARNAIAASFLPDEPKARLLAEVDTVLRTVRSRTSEPDDPVPSP